MRVYKGAELLYGSIRNLRYISLLTQVVLRTLYMYWVLGFAQTERPRVILAVYRDLSRSFVGAQITTSSEKFHRLFCDMLAYSRHIGPWPQ